MCGFVIDRYLVQQAQQAAVLTDAIKKKIGTHQALAEWERAKELYEKEVFKPIQLNEAVMYMPPPKPPKPQWDVVYSGPPPNPWQKPAQVHDAYFFDIDPTRPKPTVTAQGYSLPLPKAQETVAYYGGPLDGDTRPYVEGGPKRMPLAWPYDAFYALERIDTVWTWVYYGDEDVP